jgi:hypothetical protein
MQNFLDALNWFVVGAVIGYFWHPIWELGKKIVSEAQKARKEWKK